MLRRAEGKVRGIRAMGGQKLLRLDDQNRLVADADDFQSAAEFSIQAVGRSFRLKVHRPGTDAAGEWRSICPTGRTDHYFALCNRKDANVVQKQAEFHKICYSHWDGVPGFSNCAVFGLQFFGNNQFLTVGPKGCCNREGLLQANGGTQLGRLGVNDYHKTFMFVDLTQPEDLAEQRFVLFHSLNFSFSPLSKQPTNHTM